MCWAKACSVKQMQFAIIVSSLSATSSEIAKDTFIYICMRAAVFYG
jgi:hypothetical protein